MAGVSESFVNFPRKSNLVKEIHNFVENPKFTKKEVFSKFSFFDENYDFLLTKSSNFDFRGKSRANFRWIRPF